MYEKASKHHFSFSEFNLGRIKEIQGNIDESIEHFKKASEYENEILIFRNQITDDRRLEISKSYITSFTNFKLFHYYKQIDVKLSYDFLLNALFRPIFKLLFMMKSKSFTFVFETTQINDALIVTNLKDFILNFPLFLINNSKNSSTCWSIQENQANENVEISLLAHINNRKENSKKNDEKKKKSTDDDQKTIFNTQLIEEKIRDIFGYMNKQNQYQIISTCLENNCIKFLIQTKRNNVTRELKIHKDLININFNSINNLNDINEVIEKMGKILFEPPYLILFGRIEIHKRIDKNLDETFYAAFND